MIISHIDDQGRTIILATPTFTISKTESYLAETGAQVINLRLDNQGITATTYCANHTTDTWCLGIQEAVANDIAIVASSGNNRTNLQFPANDSRVISAVSMRTLRFGMNHP